MSVSIISSLDIDLERATISSSPFDRSESPRVNGTRLSWRNSLPRPQSRNYSRPSPPSSLSSVEHVVQRSRSSDDISRIRHAASPPQELPASPVSGKVPIFAQRAVQSAMLHYPPPIPDSPANRRRSRSRKSFKHVDVVEAAKSMPPSDWSSTRSLMSMIREKADLEPTTFAQRVFEAGKPDLLFDLRTTENFKDHRHGMLDFTTLQRMSQHVLQQKLVEQVKAIGDKGAWMEIGIRETLHEYCEAVRDLEYMQQCALRGKGNDPFLMTTANPLECKLLEEVGLAWSDPTKKRPQVGPDRLEYTKRQSHAKQSVSRLLMSLLGGLALVAPFLVMLLVEGQLVRLICVCAFMVAFAIGLPLVSEIPVDRIGLATAAYAAALIIFVGTDPPSYRYT